MELWENTSVDSRQTEWIHTPLISGLPDEIALLCLARVPRRHHHLLKCVSKRWRTLVCSEAWCSCRQKHNLHETWIYALCRDNADQACLYVLDPLRRCWKSIHGVPPRCLKRKGMACEAVGKKLYLMGGCSWLEDRTEEVYCYDASTDRWEEAAPMSTARSYFLSMALDDKLYTVGGIGLASSELSSWDTYDLHTNRWTSNWNPNVFPDVEESITMGGKIYIRSGDSTISPKAEAIVYDPLDETWQRLNDEMVSNWHGPSVVIDGVLYMLDQISGLRLMMWRKESEEWVAIGRLSLMLMRPPCQLVAVGRNIYVIGKGLGTVVVDVNKLGNVVGVMVTTSIPKSDTNDDVICCKTLAI